MALTVGDKLIVKRPDGFTAEITKGVTEVQVITIAQLKRDNVAIMDQIARHQIRISENNALIQDLLNAGITEPVDVDIVVIGNP